MNTLSGLGAMDVTSAADGDRAAFTRLVEQTKHAVTSIALGILRDARASEDVAQEVYLQAWKDLPSLRNADSFLPWIRQLTRNEAYTYARGRRRFDKRHAPWSADASDRASAEGTPIERAITEEERLVLEEALAAMPDDSRDVLTLFYREGRSVRQVALLLDLGEAAVKKRLERARAVLKADVEERFAAVASRSAVGATFVAGVAGALAFGAPSTAAAATLASKKGWLALALVSPVLAAPVISITGGIAVVVLLTRSLVRTAIDDRERRELRRLRNLACALIVGFHVALAASICSLYWSNIVADAGMLLSWLGFGAGGGYLLSHRLPIILSRRRAAERAADLASYLAAERWRRRRSYIVLAVTGTVLLVAIRVVVFPYHR